MEIIADCDLSKKKFKCEYCGKRFQRSTTLNLHRRKIHEGEKASKKCKLCGSLFFTNETLKRHKKRHEGKFTCNRCGYYFYRKENLEIHKKTHRAEQQPCLNDKSLSQSVENLFECVFCDQSFINDYLLIRHLRAHVGDLPFNSKIWEKLIASNCSQKNFPSDDSSQNSNLKVKEKLEIRPTSSKCPFCRQSLYEICNESFSKKYSLQHRLVHIGEMPFKCDHCIGSYCDLSALKIHKKEHEEEKQIKSCSVDFSDAILTMQEKFKTSENSTKCFLCENTFSNKYSLKKHLGTHADEMPSKCDICDQWFLNSYAFKYHKMTHDGEMPFKCDYCGKSFVAIQKFKAHEKEHKEEKPIKNCYDEFALAIILTMQVKFQTNENSRKCFLCENSFSSKYSLKKHLSTHAKAVPSKCDICHKWFDSYANKYHRMTHDG